MKTTITFLIAAIILAAPALAQERPGFSDTPFLPGSEFRVHDKDRPDPEVVMTGEIGAPPSDAMVLFDGTDLSAWKSPNGDAKWKVEDGVMETVPGAGDIETRESFGDCQLHLEWSVPANADGSPVGPGNSGVFMMGRYEIQIYNSHENPLYADGIAAAVYGQYPPLVNASRKPGQWQVYDIIWFAPKFEGDKLVAPARLTMFHNGVLVHHNVELIGPVCHRGIAPYQPHGDKEPLRLQDHHELVRFRNIWIRPIETGVGF